MTFSLLSLAMSWMLNGSSGWVGVVWREREGRRERERERSSYGCILQLEQVMSTSIGNWPAMSIH